MCYSTRNQQNPQSNFNQYNPQSNFNQQNQYNPQSNFNHPNQYMPQPMPYLDNDMRKYYITNESALRQPAVIDRDSLFTIDLYNTLTRIVNDKSITDFYWANTVHVAGLLAADRYATGKWMHGMYVYLNTERAVVITNDKLKVTISHCGRFCIYPLNGIVFELMSQLVEGGMVNVLKVIRDVCIEYDNFRKPQKSKMNEPKESEKASAEPPHKSHVDTNERSTENETVFDHRSLDVCARKGTGRQVNKSKLEAVIEKFAPGEDLVPYLYAMRSTLLNAMKHTTVVAGNQVHFLINMPDGALTMVVPNKWYITFKDDDEHGGSLRDFFKYHNPRDLSDVQGMVDSLRAVKEIMSDDIEPLDGLDSDK